MKRAGACSRSTHYIDTLMLSRRSFALPSHSLTPLCTHFGIARGRAHRAGDDVRALMRRLRRGASKALAPMSARDLWEVRIAERRARAAISEPCEAAVDARARPSKWSTGRPARRADA